MDTVKVDVQKLQVLNDRIAQCLDALNQVRLSAHGLQQSLGVSMAQPGVFGISHTSPQVPGAPAFGQAFTPPFLPAWGQAYPQPVTQGFGQPYGQSFGYGISHSPWTPVGAMLPVASDPFIAARIAQTFPYAFTNVPIY